MQVFLSWSGDRSKAVAEALSNWLAKVIQAVEPWMSVDIDKGARWSPEIAKRLETARVGIVCITPENQAAPWLLFEAGALSKVAGAHVCTFVVGMPPTDVAPPLGQFQHTVPNREDVWRLVETVNDILEKASEKPVAERMLKDVFNTFWPELDGQLQATLAMAGTAARATRPDRELLEEILEILRGQEGSRKSFSLADLVRQYPSAQDAGSALSPLRSAAISRVLDNTPPEVIARALAGWAESVAHDFDKP